MFPAHRRQQLRHGDDAEEQIAAGDRVGVRKISGDVADVLPRLAQNRNLLELILATMLWSILKKNLVTIFMHRRSY